MSVAPWLSYHLQYTLLGKPYLRYQRRRDERALRKRYAQGDDVLTPPLLGTMRMKELLSSHYLAGRFANGLQKVAWVTSATPVEILEALDFFLVYPDNHAALCGARRKAVDLCEVSEDAGYSRDICSYVRTDIGSLLSGDTPVGRLPRPDLILCCNNICQTILHWYHVLATHFQVPLFVIDTPFLYGEAKPHQIAFVKQQLEELIPIAERIAGKRVSETRLREVTRRGKEASELWLEILNRAKTHPSPISAFDAFIHMGPVVALRFRPTTIAYYRELLAEIDDRIARGIGAIRNERRRVLWDNLPIWYRLNWLSRLLGTRGVNVVLSNYTYAWGELAPMMDATRPLDSAAKVYLHGLLNRSNADKMQAMTDMVRDFALDGVILHSDRSCKPYSLGQVDQRTRLVNGMQLPALLLEADHNDARIFSEEQVTNRLDAFVEMLN